MTIQDTINRIAKVDLAKYPFVRDVSIDTPPDELIKYIMMEKPLRIVCSKKIANVLSKSPLFSKSSEIEFRKMGNYGKIDRTYISVYDLDGINDIVLYPMNTRENCTIRIL